MNAAGDFLRLALGAQGIYYVITGVWPMVSMRSFEAVTGPKTDGWLVRMVGLLALVIGATLLASLQQDTTRAPILLLSVGSAASFAAIDIRYAMTRRISRIYLLDAAAEIVLIAVITAGWWAFA